MRLWRLLSLTSQDPRKARLTWGLCFGAMCLGLGAAGAGRLAAATRGPAAGGPARPKLYRIDLQPTEVGGGASAVATLRMAPSPFGITLTPDGHFLYDVKLIAKGLQPASSRGAYTTYVAWVTTGNLDPVRQLGAIRNGQTISGQVDYNKFIVLITAERDAKAAHWHGPIVLRGLSASMYLDNFSGKTFFNNGVPQ